ncbi:MAG: 50S ribosomal protein L23 [Elusimicrobia bacterium]|nr:50S ribosomal protein L23 [Elusimicrobiota bacterium]
MKLSNASILLYPVFTEKSEKLRKEQNIYTFVVNKKARKNDVKRAVEEVFKVKVQDVRLVPTRPKLRRRGIHTGYTSKHKKAYIKLSKGSSISGFEVV